MDNIIYFKDIKDKKLSNNSPTVVTLEDIKLQKEAILEQRKEILKQKEEIYGYND